MEHKYIFVSIISAVCLLAVYNCVARFTEKALLNSSWKRSASETINKGKVMQIELDLVRTILLHLEAECYGHVITQIIMPEWSDDQITYHIWYLGEVGYISVRIHTLPDRTNPLKQRIVYSIDGLNLIGHEFAEDTRSQLRWTNIKSIASERGVDGLRYIRSISSAYVDAHLS